MNRLVFGAKNIRDKLTKVARDPRLAHSYLHAYVLGPLLGPTPDAYVVSYPKCGRTWLRVMLQAYGEHAGLRPQALADRSYLRVGPGALVRFRHTPGNWVPAPKPADQLRVPDKYRGSRVVFLVRDPRDVLVSSYYHLRVRERIYNGSISEFVRHDLVGTRKVIEFMNCWLDFGPQLADLLLVRYEALHTEPDTQLERIVRFLDLPIDAEAVASAVERASFSSMQAMEADHSARHPWLHTDRRTPAQGRKVRRGKVGGFLDDLPAEDLAYVDGVIAAHLSKQLGYR